MRRGIVGAGGRQASRSSTREDQDQEVPERKVGVLCPASTSAASHRRPHRAAPDRHDDADGNAETERDRERAGGEPRGVGQPRSRESRPPARAVPRICRDRDGAARRRSRGYCSLTGRSKPSSWRNASIASRDALSGTSSSVGSPESRITTKTMASTPKTCNRRLKSAAGDIAEHRGRPRPPYPVIPAKSCPSRRTPHPRSAPSGSACGRHKVAKS